MSTKKAGAVPVLSPAESAESLYREYVNPQWARSLQILRLDVHFVRCSGARLCTDDGREILDFLSGYRVHNYRPQSPAMLAALDDELQRRYSRWYRAISLNSPAVSLTSCVRVPAGKHRRFSFAAPAAKGSRLPSNLRALVRSVRDYCTPEALFTA